MVKSRFSSQRRRIHAFAREWAKAKMGPGYHAHGGQRRAVLMHVVTDYALNWLAQHGEMPDGVHTARAKRIVPGLCSKPPVLEVDYSRLHHVIAPRAHSLPS
ncbi:hypothetical protein [Mesorhizobium sp.]|uniref:hypothetical protein n=1 Tax=Mesorhizobium sp. TaxID=1871066 RepID=UPI00121CF1C3|nr:hypothetical protein [Mesorhizobium sp.]TIM38305.1 MAG: hypothetical protein E5Y56_30230 [Mesorhizobium sp.]